MGKRLPLLSSAVAAIIENLEWRNSWETVFLGLHHVKEGTNLPRSQGMLYRCLHMHTVSMP